MSRNNRRSSANMSQQNVESAIENTDPENFEDEINLNEGNEMDMDSTTSDTVTETTVVTEAPTEIVVPVNIPITSSVVQANTLDNLKGAKDDNVVDADKDFNQYVEKIKLTGNKELLFIIQSFETYISKMAPGIPVTNRDGAKNQEVLWTAIKNVIENHDKDFRKSWNLVTNYFKNYSKHCFSFEYVHRFTEHIALSSTDNRLMEEVYAILMESAKQNTTTGIKWLNFDAALKVGLTEKSRSKLLNFYNA